MGKRKILRSRVPVRWIVGGVLVLVVTAVWIWHLRPTIEDASSETLAAVVSGRSEDALRFMGDADYQASKLTRRQAERVLREYVAPVFRDARGGEVAIDVIGNSAQAIAYQVLETPDGRRFAVNTMATSAPAGVTTPNVIAEAVFCAFAAKHSSGQAVPRGVDKLRAWRDGIDRDRELLESMGLKGLSSPEGFHTWDELRASLTARIERGESSDRRGR